MNENSNTSGWELGFVKFFCSAVALAVIAWATNRLIEHKFSDYLPTSKVAGSTNEPNPVAVAPTQPTTPDRKAEPGQPTAITLKQFEDAAAKGVAVAVEREVEPLKQKVIETNSAVRNFGKQMAEHSDRLDKLEKRKEEKQEPPSTREPSDKPAGTESQSRKVPSFDPPAPLPQPAAVIQPPPLTKVVTVKAATPCRCPVTLQLPVSGEEVPFRCPRSGGLYYARLVKVNPPTVGTRSP